MMEAMRLVQVVAIALVLLVSFSNAFTMPPAMRGNCRFFLDTADTQEWDALLPLGIFHGVTTDPTLLERAGHSCTIDSLHQLSQKALGMSEEFMVQAWGETSTDLYKVGMALSEPSRDRIVVKVPVTVNGVKAARLLWQSGVRVCLTACYASHQALIAVGVGAHYIAPYLGRMSDAGKNGLEECIRMQDIVDGVQAETRILVASIRSVESMVELAEWGLDTFTFSPEVARSLFDEPLTDQAAADFEEAAKRGGGTVQ